MRCSKQLSYEATHLGCEAIGYFGKYHNIFCLSPQILHKHSFQFLLGNRVVPRENKNNAHAKFGGTNKEYYGIFRSGLLWVLKFSGVVKTIAYIASTPARERGGTLCERGCKLFTGRWIPPIFLTLFLPLYCVPFIHEPSPLPSPQT